MYLTGFADEAAPDIAGQIRATQTLGWRHIEARFVEGVNLQDVSEDTFEMVRAELDRAGITVNCLGSAIGNWAKAITDPFEETLAEVDRAISRMKRLGTKLVRIMSYPVLTDRAPDDQMVEERIKRLREVVARFTGEGCIPLHENCMNYGGMGWSFTLQLIEQVPRLGLVFDTGNPIGSRDFSATEPRDSQDVWEFYRKVKQYISYIHIKDGVLTPGVTEGQPLVTYVMPGDGLGYVRRIVKDVIDGGYDGGFSMEPHLPLKTEGLSPAEVTEQRFASYVEYGRRFMEIIADCGYAQAYA